MGKELNIVENKPDTQDQEKQHIQQNGKKISKDDKEKLRKAQKRKNKKEKKKLKKQSESDVDEVEENYQKLKEKIAIEEGGQAYSEINNDDIEYVDVDEYILTGTYYEEFKDVFQYFKKPKHLIEIENTEEGKEQGQENSIINNDVQTIDTDQTTGLGLGDSVDLEGQKEKALTKKERKHLKRLKTAQLKALVKRPDLVEAWDITSYDPLFLVFLKSYKNTVQVPRHWCQKRKFLQNKRGILKQPFQLPEWIEATGISKLRDVFDRDGTKMVRQKLRERMNPKMGKIDIDYEVLHDAFFKFQQKPQLTTHGDIYYEGKENEVKMKQTKPGRISEELRQALGITEFAPPPWIVNMQRYGPPPSYPNLKIPGLNSQLTEGQFYAKPQDDQGKHALTGNAYGPTGQEEQPHHTLWGEIVQEQVEEEEQEGDEEHDEDGEQFDHSDMSTKPEDKSGITSLISGMDTPEMDIRKQPAMQKPPLAPSALDKPLYQVLEPIQKSVGNAFLGTTHGYKIPDQLKK